MKLRKLAAAAVSAVMSVSMLGMQLPAADAADYVQRKSRVSVHDPSVIKDPATGMYYVFGSHIDAAKSADLQSWQAFTNGYARTGNKLFGDLSGNLKPAFAWAGEGNPLPERLFCRSCRLLRAQFSRLRRNLRRPHQPQAAQRIR